MVLQSSSIELDNVYMRAISGRLGLFSWSSFVEYCKYVVDLMRQSSMHQETIKLGVSSMMDQWKSRINSLNFKSLVDIDQRFHIVPINYNWVGDLWQLKLPANGLLDDESLRNLTDWSEACCAFRAVQGWQLVIEIEFVFVVSNMFFTFESFSLSEFWADFPQRIVDFVGVKETVLVLVSNMTSISEETFSQIRIAVNKSLAYGNSLLKIRSP